MRTIIKGLVLALSTSFIVACGGGNPISKGLDHQIAMLKIVEANKTDAAKAATELEGYIKSNEADIKAISEAMQKMQAEIGDDMTKLADIMKDNASKLQELQTLEEKVSTEAKDVYNDEKVSGLLRSLKGM